jgi:signal transduction histidine kinase
VTINAGENEAVLVIENIKTTVTPVEIEHLFKKYYRGKNSQGISGSGVGLYLVRRIIEKHGGTVEACHTADDCFRVTVRLPQ